MLRNSTIRRAKISVARFGLSWVFAASTWAQTSLDPNEPLGGERMLLPSYEIMELRRTSMAMASTSSPKPTKRSVVRAYLGIMETDEGHSGSVSVSYAALGVMGGESYERQIRLVAGNVDADPELELVFAYHTSGSSMSVEFLEVDRATLEPTRVNTSSVDNTTTGAFTCSAADKRFKARCRHHRYQGF